MSANNGTRKISTIRVNHASHDFGVTEEQFRPWLQPFYKNWRKIKRIKYEYYELIVESIAERIQELEAQEQEPEVQQEIETPESPNNDGTTSSLAVVDESDEEIEVSPQEAKEQLRIQMQTVSHLPEQALKLNRLTKITAVALSQENLQDFEQIYTHRMNNGINKIISNQTAVTMGALRPLAKVFYGIIENFVSELTKYEILASLWTHCVNVNFPPENLSDLLELNVKLSN